jgi:hypothetical protein
VTSYEIEATKPTLKLKEIAVGASEYLHITISDCDRVCPFDTDLAQPASVAEHSSTEIFFVCSMNDLGSRSYL